MKPPGAVFHGRGRMPTDGPYEIEGNGLLGAKEKRKAQALFMLASMVEDDWTRERYLQQSLDSLVLAGRHYHHASAVRTTANGPWRVGAPHWVLTQALSVDAALGMPLSLERWRHACSSAEVDLLGTPVDVAWAHGSLVELYLLHALVVESETAPLSETYPQKSAQAVADAVRLMRLDPFIVESTKRQISRYLDWWNNQLWIRELEKMNRRRSNDSWERLTRLASHVVRILGVAA